MRDASIHQMNQNMEKRLAQMYKQIQFLDCRMRAYETILNDRWSLVKFIWNPKKGMKDIDQMQMMYLKLHDEKIREAVQKRQEEESKPKITLLSGTQKPNGNGLKGLAIALCLIALLPSCVSKKVYKHDIGIAYASGFKQAELDCDQTTKELNETVEQYGERLKLFNQIGSDGSLYPLKKKWIEPKTSEMEERQGS